MTKRRSRARLVSASLTVMTLLLLSTLADLSLNPATVAASGSSGFGATTYGNGLSGGPVYLDDNQIAALEGSPATLAHLEANVSKLFVPIGVNLVFLDVFWGSNDANTTTTFVAGGYDQDVANWLKVGDMFNIKTVFFFKQFGYFFSAPSWDQDFLNAYPSAATANDNGTNIPLSSCSAGCTAASGWTIASPDVYKQLEEDVKQT